MSEINVTPMVDVMLVLLIIFMVAAPLLQVGVPIELPQAKGKQLESNKEPLAISVKADGSVFIGETACRSTRSRQAQGDRQERLRRADFRARRQGRRLRHGHARHGPHQRRRFKKVSLVTEVEEGGKPVVQLGLAISFLITRGLLAWAYLAMASTPELRPPEPEPITVDAHHAVRASALKKGSADLEGARGQGQGRAQARGLQDRGGKAEARRSAGRRRKSRQAGARARSRRQGGSRPSPRTRSPRSSRRCRPSRRRPNADELKKAEEQKKPTRPRSSRSSSRPTRR